MAAEFCLIALARRLAEIAAQTREHETAANLIALANEVIAATDHPAETPRSGPHDLRWVRRRDALVAAAS